MNDMAKPKIWVPGDWNAFFGFGTNILVNLLTLTALLRFVLKLPDDLVFHTILPATGMMMFLSTVYYAWLAYGLAKKTGRICRRIRRYRNGLLPAGRSPRSISLRPMMAVRMLLNSWATPPASFPTVSIF